MTHVDTLSRSVGYVNELPLEREMELRQSNDPRIKEISESLEIKDDEKFDLIKLGLVYRKDGTNRKFVVPDSMINNILRTYHDDMAHCGMEKITQGIAQRYWFPSTREKIADYIENCFTCVMSNNAMNRFEGETHLFPSAKSPMEMLHIDHFDPLQETDAKYKYILVIVDAFTRFTWLCATKTTGSKESINHLQTIFDTFGKPGKIISVRGTAFTSKEFTDFTNMRNIKHQKVAVAAPWANGLDERINRFLKSSLTKVTTVLDDWKNKLGMIQYIVNNIYHSAVKSSTSKLLDYE